MLKSFIGFWHTAKKTAREELSPIFNLKKDVDEEGTLQEIRESTEFRGARVWTLIFAVFIASIGLNVNSTAVIIGAMLISPLMGPIVGAGLALGTNDFQLLKRAIRNLAIATSVSMVTSAIYFLVSPLAEAQSELLARTSPTLYDVLIALCGGATGIIAGSRRERSIHAISGVAIATALMPPLCTAGYGIASRTPAFFLGALYLFIINAFYILLATYIVVRFLGFKKKTDLNIASERRMSFYMTSVALLIAIPSAYTGYQTVSDAIFISNVDRFVKENFHFSETRILDRTQERRREGNLIEITTIGKELNEKNHALLKEKLPFYGLANTALLVRPLDSTKISADESTIAKKQEQKVTAMENELLKYRSDVSQVAEIGPELVSLNPKIGGFSFGTLPAWDSAAEKAGSENVYAILKWKQSLTPKEQMAVEKFLKVRLKSESIQFIHKR